MINGIPVIAVSNDAFMREESRGASRIISINALYTGALARAGAAPILTCEEAPDVTERICDALVLTGGTDIDPRLFGQEVMYDSVKLDNRRTDFEMRLAGLFYEAKKPILGICRGCQLINVLLGGTLYQDLPEQKQTNHYDSNMRHEIEVEPGSVLYGLYGPKFRVNSTHHQSVRDLGDGLRAVAHTPGDRIVEAIEHKSLPIWGYQFHPERMIGLESDKKSPDFMALFEDFVRRVS